MRHLFTVLNSAFNFSLGFLDPYCLWLMFDRLVFVLFRVYIQNKNGFFHYSLNSRHVYQQQQHATIPTLSPIWKWNRTVHLTRNNRNFPFLLFELNFPKLTVASRQFICARNLPRKRWSTLRCFITALYSDDEKIRAVCELVSGLSVTKFQASRWCTGIVGKQ